MRLKFCAIMLIILAAAVFACGCTGTIAVPQGEVQEILVGVLLPLSGDFMETGQSSNAGIEVAMEDINNHLVLIDSRYRVRTIVEDTATDPVVALEKLTSLDKQGIRVVIGLGSSAELNATRTYADEHGIILISTMSTAPSLAIAGDNVFRFVPPDTFQATAMAYYLKEDGITAVVPVWRGDIWGDELRNLTKAAVEKENGTVLNGVRLPVDSDEYAGTVAALDVQVGRAVAAYGKEKVGVYAITFDEVVPLMSAASQTSNLSQVRWYGSDANVLLGSLTAPGDAARFAAHTNFTGPTFWQSGLSKRSEAVLSRIQDWLGRQPDGYSLVSYDTLRVAALAGTQTASTHVSKVKTALAETAAMIISSTGAPIETDAAGDRSTAHYCFWSLEASSDSYRWIPLAQYDVWSTGEIPEFKWIDA